MAVTWTTFADGVSLLTLRNSLNTFNNSVVTNIGTIETDVTNLTSSKITASDTGLSFITGGALAGIALTTAYQKVKMVDTHTINLIGSHATVDTVNATVTINTTGVYKFVFSGSMTAPNGSYVTFNYNVNGVSYLATPPAFVGLGTKPVSLGEHTVISLTAGAVIYIEAKGDSSFTMTPSGCGFMIEKTHY